MRGFKDAFITTARTAFCQEFAGLRFEAFSGTLTIPAGALLCREKILRRGLKWYKPWLHGGCGVACNGLCWSNYLTGSLCTKRTRWRREEEMTTAKRVEIKRGIPKGVAKGLVGITSTGTLFRCTTAGGEAGRGTVAAPASGGVVPP